MTKPEEKAWQAVIRIQNNKNTDSTQEEKWDQVFRESERNSFIITDNLTINHWTHWMEWMMASETLYYKLSMYLDRRIIWFKGPVAKMTHVF